MPPKGFMDKLKFCNYKLETLLSITQSINNNEPVSVLLSRFRQLLHDELDIPNILLYSHAPNWQPLLVSGKGALIHSKIDVDRDLIGFKSISTTNFEKNELLSHFDMIIPVYHKDNPLAFLLVGDSAEHPGMSYSIKHLQFIQTITNIILVAIENKRLAKEQSKQEAFVADMELAARMQKLLIPKNEDFPRNRDIEVSAFYKPHLYVGGDFYDFVQLGPSEYGFAIADVTGKGVSAALLMSNLQANLRLYFTADISLSDLVHILNTKVLDVAGGDRFITMFLARYNARTRQLNYINAGHIPPVLHLPNRDLRYLHKGCVGLGMLDEIPAIAVGDAEIPEKARLVCYTDGLAEMNQGGEVVEQYKHIEACALSEKPIDEAIGELIEPIRRNIDSDDLFDDISLLVVDML